MRTLFLPAVLLALAVAPLSRSQSLSITTLAGSPGQGSADGTASAARFANPWGVAADAAGNVYVGDTDNHTIRKITAGSVVSTLAGMPGVSGSADGTGADARFNRPQGIAVDEAGNVYVADTGNDTIRKITPAGTVTTLAGSAGNPGSTDATGSNARFYEPEGIAVNGKGRLIYVADTWNHTIRQVTSAGAVTTLAGSAGNYGSADGSGASARFYQPQGLAVDGAGNVYVGDTGNHTIRRVSPAGVVTTLAGFAGNYGSADGSGSSASFWAPQGVALDSATNLFVADSFNNTIRKVTPAGVVTTLAGSAGSLGSADGTGTAARFWQPQGVAVDSAGTIYVADSANDTIRQIASGALVTTLAGSASIGSADGAGNDARFFWPSGAAIDSQGNSYVADTGNGTIREITAAGVVSTLAGSAGSFGSTDSSGSGARFYAPQAVAAGTSGNLYVADTANDTIRKITSGGVVSTLAGLAGTSGIADGTGSNARFNAPQALAVDSSDNVYVADTWNHTIRKVTPGGVVTTLAGVPGSCGDIDGTSAGDGTNTARFYCPSGIAVDGSGNVYVADTRNHTIREVTPAGVVSTLAGLAGVWGNEDGTNSSARFNQPRGITVDFSGNLYVLDSGNHTIRMVAPMGTNWVVTTVAGLPGVSGSADGVGSAAGFFYPGGISVNNSGSFCVADSGNNTLRAGLSSLNASPTILTQPQDQTATQGQAATFSVIAAGAPPLTYQWRLYGTNLADATSSSYTCVSAQPANAGPYSVVVSNSLGSITSSNALLTVIVPPAITDPPQDLAIDQGMSANFEVTVSGTAPFTYQWLFDGDVISATSASSYTRTNAQPADAGSYSVIVANSAGSVTSPPAILTVNPVPTQPGIAAQPQSQIVGQGSNATFTVTAYGSTPLHYQWLFHGGTLAGATDSSYTRFNAQAVDTGPYSVIITNAYGSIASLAATLTVILPPIISVQPANQLASVSNSITFTVGLSQGTSPAYQWRRNGTPIAEATQSSLSLSPLSWSDAGTYSVVVSNAVGSVTSADASLVVQQAAFTFFDGFEGYNLGSLDNNTSGGPNATATNPWWGVNSTAQGAVTDASSGVTPHGGSKMAGTSGRLRQDYINLLYRMNAGQPYYGNFMCDWWFYDPYGTNPNGATSLQDYLALCQYSPVSTTGDTSSFSAYNQRMSLGAYNGSTGYNYSNYQARIIGGAGTFGSQNSWYNTATVRSVGWHHSRIVVGIPDPSTLLAPVSMYIDDMINPTVSSPTTGVTGGLNLIELNHEMSTSGYFGYYDDLTFRAANDPWIVEQPVSQTVGLGQPVSFTTVAVGTAYQWQLNGHDIGGATASTYSVASAGANDVGSYACVITGANGEITTSNAMLTVTGLPAQPGHFDSLRLLGDGSLQLNMSGTPNTNYVLEFTTNWATWSSLATLSGTNGLFQFDDPAPATNSERLYRLRLAP